MGSVPGQDIGRATLRGGSAVLAALLMAGTAFAAPAKEEAGVTCSVEMVAMRDGVKLATEVYRPGGSGKFPVIIQRSPYNYLGPNTILGDHNSDCKRDALLAWAARGYVVLNQDIRGTYRSEGDFHPVLQEADDGFDVVEWAARQSWSTGKVGMMGGSYLGLSQWQAALKRPPHLVTIVPTVAPTSFDDAWPYYTGVFGQFVVQTWTGYIGQDQLARKLTRQHAPSAQIAAEVAAYNRHVNEAVLAPSREAAPLLGNALFNSDLTPWYSQWLQRQTLEDQWKAKTVEDKYPSLSIPVLSLGGFYDLFVSGTVDGFSGMQQRAATPQARAAARMILAGPGHAAGLNNYIGQLTFGPDNAIPLDETVRWFDHWLKGIDNGVTKEPAVKVYVMVPPDVGSVGSGFWTSGDSFPFPGTKDAKYYLLGGRANSLGGNGTLSTTPSAEAGTDRYQYDPAHPAPTVGGVTCCSPGLIQGGAFDQRPVEIRADVLVYTGEVLKTAIPVVGPASVTLTASSSAPRTAFTAKLVDVHPDGYAQIIADGIVETDAAAPASTATYTIRMNPTATVFRPGHRIRVEISSSNYPRFRAHPNTTDPLGTARDMVIADQTVQWGGSAMTALSLPVAPIALPRDLSP